MGRMKYQKLVHLNIDHEYYANGYARSGLDSSPDLTILPLIATERLDKLGLRCTSLRQNSISIYGEVEPGTAPGDEQQYYLNKLRNNPDGVIYFALIPLNLHYALASDLPLDRTPDQCLFLSNRNVGNAKNTLSKGAHINWNADVFRIQTGEYRYVHPEKLRTDEAFLQTTDARHKIYPSIKIDRPNATELVFDQHQIQPGFYQLMVKNQAQPIQFLLGNWTRNLPLAIVELAWGAGLPPEAKLWQDDFRPKPSAPTFKAVFLARKAKWQYTFAWDTLINPQGDGPPSVSELKLKMDDEDAFTAEVVAEPGKKAGFISKEELSLGEIPKHKISLTYKIDGHTRPAKTIRLPSVEALYKTTDNQIQTHISITL